MHNSGVLVTVVLWSRRISETQDSKFPPLSRVYEFGSEQPWMVHDHDEAVEVIDRAPLQGAVRLCMCPAVLQIFLVAFTAGTATTYHHPVVQVRQYARTEVGPEVLLIASLS